MSIPTPITIKTEPETAPITVKAEPGTIPITVKAEPGTIPPIINAGPVAEAVASSSTPRRKSSRVSQASQKVLEENDIYAVEKIIARSLHEGLGPDGRYEHQYLVRWEGYGPGDDTWEMSSNILQGSAEIVKAYESKEQPITVVEKQIGKGRYGETKYQVEVCGSRRGKEKNWSPLAEQEWMSEKEMKTLCRISQGTVRAAIREWEVGQVPTPRATPSSGSSTRSVTTPTKVAPSGPQRGPRYAERALMEILDDKRYRRSFSSNRSWKRRYLVRHNLKDKLRGYQERTEWYSNNHLLNVFGHLVMREKLAEYRPEPKVEPETQRGAEPTIKQERLEDGTIVDVRHDVITDYEKERLRRIKENEDLIKRLGLGM